MQNEKEREHVHIELSNSFIQRYFATAFLSLR